MDPGGPVAQAGEARQDRTGSPAMAVVVEAREMGDRPEKGRPGKTIPEASRNEWFTLAG